MVQTYVVLALVICKIFLPWVPLQIVHFLGNFVPYPEKSHFHGSQTLPLDGVVRNTHRSGVVTMHRGLWLRMAHVRQCESENNASLAIMVKCTEFCFGCGCDDESQNCCAHVKSAIQTNRFAIAWHPTEEKMATCPATGFGLRKVRGIGVDI
jgi:hypothetical protein